MSGDRHREVEMRVTPYNHRSKLLKYPMFYCEEYDDYVEVCGWMGENKVEHFPWLSGSNGYIFDVRGENANWFLLRFS